MQNIINFFNYEKNILLSLSPNGNKYLLKKTILDKKTNKFKEYYYINEKRIVANSIKSINFLDNETILYLNNKGLFSLKNKKNLIINGKFDNFEILNSSKIILWKNFISEEENPIRKKVNKVSQKCQIIIYDIFDMNKIFFEIDDGNIVSCNVFGNEAFFLIKNNYLSDFPEQLWKLDNTNLKIINKDTFSFINLIGKIENKIIFIGYKQCPSNASMEKQILFYDEKIQTIESLDLLLRGTLLEASLSGKNIIIRESNNFNSLVYLVKYDSKEILNKIDIPKFIRNIKVSANSLYFLEEDFFMFPIVKKFEMNEFFNYKFVGDEEESKQVKIITWEYKGLKIEGALFIPEKKVTKNLAVITTGRSNQFVRCHYNSSDLTGGNDNFPYPIQNILKKGYSVFLCNCRANVFHDFENRNNSGYKRLAEYSEILNEGIKKVKALFKFENIFILAWSLGAYIAADLAFKSKDTIYNLILGNGVYNLISMYSTSNVFEFIEFMGGDILETTKLESYIKSSPFFKSKNFHGKILLQHIAEDQVMPISQSKEFYYQLIFSNKKVELIIYKEHEHNFIKGASLLQASNDVLYFLDKNKVH